MPHSSTSQTQQLPAEDTIDLQKALLLFWRGKFLVLLFALVGIVFGLYYIYFLATPTYRSSAVLMLDTRQEQVVNLESVISGVGSDQVAINTEVEVLQSRVLLGLVVDELQLTKDPEFNPSLLPPPAITKFKLSARKILGLHASESNQVAENERRFRERETAISLLLSKITVRNIPGSLVFEVSVSTLTPTKSAKISDALLDQYILNQLHVKFEATEQATAWLSERVAELQVSLEEAESAISSFSSQTDLISPETLNSMEIQFKELRDRMSEAQEAVESSRNQIARMEQARTRSEKAAITGDAVLQNQLSQINQPGVAEAFDSRFAMLQGRVENNLEFNLSQIAAMENSTKQLKLQIDIQSKDLIKLQQLTREAEANRLLYEYFLTRLKETSVQAGIQQADSRILSPAVIPAKPATPRKALVVVFSLILGGIVGAGVVLIRELRSEGFRTAEDVENSSGYSVIGQIPLVAGRQRQMITDYLIQNPTSVASEAVRNLRTSLMLSNADAPPQAIMLSSSIPGEGKSTIAVSLAANFSMMGKKVILVEGDIRRRMLNSYFSIESNDGIAGILGGDITLDEAIQTHDGPVQLDLLLGGSVQSNAADLFSSNRFKNLINELRKRYDIIIIDTPPVLAVPDARIIAQHIDATAFVVKWNSTPSEQVLAALQEFNTVGCPVAGIALNQINLRDMQRYGYGGSYGAYGSPYYNN